MKTSAFQSAAGLKRTRWAYRRIVRLVSQPFCWLASLSLVAGSSLYFLIKSHVNGDVAFYLYAGKRIVEGAVLYRDVGDMNPPLLYFLNVPSAYLGRWLGTPAHVPFFVGLWFLMFGILYEVARLLVATKTCSRIWTYPTLLLIAFDFGIWNRGEVGQRDHVVAYLFLPFVLSLAARIEGQLPSRFDALAISIVTAIGIALKPYFLVPWFMVLAYVAWKNGPVKTARLPEFWVVVLVNLLHLAVVLICFPLYLPMIRLIVLYYHAYDISLGEFRWLVVPCGLLIAAKTIRVRASMRHVLSLCAITSFGFMCEIVAQRKGWSYHYVPMWLFLKAVVVLLLLDLMQSPRIYRRWTYWKPALVLLAACALPAGYAVARATRIAADDTLDFLCAVLQEQAHGRPVLVLGSELWFSSPLVYEAGVDSALPALCQWMLPTMYADQVQAAGGKSGTEFTPARYHAYTEATPDERAVKDEIERVLREKRPGLILVQGATEKYGFGRLDFSFLDYLASDSRNLEALGHYRPIVTGESILLQRQKD
jgi:hypothetical protein